MLTRRACIAATGLGLGLAPGVAPAAPAPRAMIRLLTPGARPAPCPLDALAWMEGSWLGRMPFGPVEIAHLPIAFGHMPGFVRATNADGVVFYEILTYVQAGDSVTLRVKHFTSQLHGWEDRDAFVARALVERAGDTFFFDGTTIRRTGPDSYTTFHLNRDGDKELETLSVPFTRIGPGR
ncbi:DUF6265 family protein [Caulobacter segnis]|uniref:DUF6265 family protein n=1 Tax=Caulobacter segnis TaxID=88688 RepID=UPI001CC09527|nr:DUF6265 family protein [Caulobacter segnis]UAL09259.1 DUF6265 family protein [Caulobacter segnis]